MITAKNYAAQAERGLIKYSKWLKDNGRPNDSAKNNFVIEDLKDSVKFAMPDGGRILKDFHKGLIGQEIRMPYPITSLEYYAVDSDPERTIEDMKNIPEHLKGSVYYVNKRILVCIDDPESDHITFNMVGYINEKWKSCPVIGGINRTKHASADGRGPFFKMYVNFDDMDFTNDHLDLFDVQISESTVVILEFLEALSCRNVEQSIYQKASPKNAQRIKSHKLPIYETKVLTLKPTVSQVSGAQSLGTHASPRQHLRRGHIRRLESGNIWVNACVVGDASKGVINKQYKMAI